MEGEKSTGLGAQVLNTDPKATSLNAVFAHAKETAFSVNIDDLQKHSEWSKAFGNNIEFFMIGAAYNNNPEDYCHKFFPTYFDQLIYIENSTATVPFY